MQIASEYVKDHIFDLNDEKLVEAINSLRLMFIKLGLHSFNHSTNAVFVYWL